MPKEWRQAHITAIFKKGSRKIACNHRSVSFTSMAPKIMESLIRDVMIAHMRRIIPLSNRQYVLLRAASNIS